MYLDGILFIEVGRKNKTVNKREKEQFISIDLKMKNSKLDVSFVDNDKD